MARKGIAKEGVMAKRSQKPTAKEGNRLVDLSMSDATAAEAVKGGVTKVEENMAQKDLLRKAQRALLEGSRT